MKYPLGIQTFEDIRTEGYLYMDKTAMVYDLAKGKTPMALQLPSRHCRKDSRASSAAPMSRRAGKWSSL